MRHTFVWCASTSSGAPTDARNGSIVHGRNAYIAASARSGGGRELSCSRSVGHPTTSTSTPRYPPTLRSQSLVDALESNSSRWIHQTFPQLRLFAWQKGYSALSVCRRCEGVVIRYIRNQETHHGPTRKGGENES